MTIEQRTSILIRKYGSKMLIRDNSSSLYGDEQSFSNNMVLPEQLWIDLKTVPKNKNPLLNSPVNLSTWPSGSNDPIITKIIKKPLQWIEGTTAFYDPSDPSDPSTVIDIISPSVDASYAPYVYVLNTQTNRYLHNISPNEYNWVFDYESGCLVFLDGFPSFMKSPQFQPPAITCYRYLGRKTAIGISSGLITGPTGPTGPIGPTGPTNHTPIVWRGEYDQTIGYSVDDAVYKDGVVWVKTTGPTGPTDVTSAYFDSITYNELIDGFLPVLNEQYIDIQYTVNESPYFDSLNELSFLLSSDFLGVGDELKNNDQNINVFNTSGQQDFYSKTFPPYSNRLYFFSPKNSLDPINIYLEGAGYRILSIDGMRSSESSIITQSFLSLSTSRITGSGEIQFIPNSSVVPDGYADLTSSFSSSFFQDQIVEMRGTSQISSCDFNKCSIVLGDSGINRPLSEDYDGVVHYFKGSRFIDTTFELSYTGERPNVIIIFDKCQISDSRIGAIDAGFSFPNRPYPFSLDNPNAIDIRLIFIDTAVSCTGSQFNLIDGSVITLMGTNVFPYWIGTLQKSTGFSSGIVSSDEMLNQFLQNQNAYSLLNPRATTNFYFNP
jgi:hypothetical protein